MEEDLELHGGIFKKDKLYLAVETEDGDIRLIKYIVNMPSATRGPAARGAFKKTAPKFRAPAKTFI